MSCSLKFPGRGWAMGRLLDSALHHLNFVAQRASSSLGHCEEAKQGPEPTECKEG